MDLLNEKHGQQNSEMTTEELHLAVPARFRNSREEPKDPFAQRFGAFSLILLKRAIIEDNQEHCK